MDEGKKPRFEPTPDMNAAQKEMTPAIDRMKGMKKRGRELLSQKFDLDSLLRNVPTMEKIREGWREIGKAITLEALYSDTLSMLKEASQTIDTTQLTDQLRNNMAIVQTVWNMREQEYHNDNHTSRPSVNGLMFVRDSSLEMATAGAIEEIRQSIELSLTKTEGSKNDSKTAPEMHVLPSEGVSTREIAEFQKIKHDVEKARKNLSVIILTKEDIETIAQASHEQTGEEIDHSYVFNTLQRNYSQVNETTPVVPCEDISSVGNVICTEFDLEQRLFGNSAVPDSLKPIIEKARERGNAMKSEPFYENSDVFADWATETIGREKENQDPVGWKKYFPQGPKADRNKYRMIVLNVSSDLKIFPDSVPYVSPVLLRTFVESHAPNTKDEALKALDEILERTPRFDDPLNSLEDIGSDLEGVHSLQREIDRLKEQLREAGLVPKEA